AIFVCLTAASNSAFAQTKSLKLYFLHTGEKNTVTYYKNGRYVAAGLKKINWALRDWRRNEPTKMDPKLLDLIWEAYRRSGSKKYIHVVSGYRSPKTNESLRKRGGGQAKKSQHTLGRALDFFLPDVKISKLRDIGLKMGVGGVGYYPRSGSPFVHFDTGSVRHWPRMSRKQLVAVFPKGKTMHVPKDGKPLSKYKTAVAEYKKRKASGKSVPTTTKKELNFFQRIAANTRADEQEDEGQTTALPRAVKSVKAPTIKPPTPKPVIKPVIGTGGSPVEVTGPLSITAPTPSQSVEPIAPTKPEVPEQDPFIVLASRQVPVPEFSPRNTLVAVNTAPAAETREPAAIEVAEAQTVEPPILEPVKQEVQTPIEVAEAEILAPVTEPVSEQLALGIPVPTARPSLQTKTQNEDVIVVASLDTKPNEEPLNSAGQPALTPNDISNLRNQAKQNEETNKPQVAETPTEAPIVEPITTANQAIEIAAPILKPQTPSVIEPSTTLALASENASQNAEQALDAALNVNKPELEILEPGAPIDIANNANIPLPTPNPRFIETLNPSVVDNNASNIELAALQQEDAVETFINDVNNIGNNTQLGNRTVSLDKLSAPQENTSQIGLYAMASNVSIEDLGDVQAPAYGRNVIRNAPTAVFKEGFRSNITPTNTRSFSGKAIVFKDFAKLSQNVQ
ncbi:MAG: DUF882 domain-containing protein, partial [Nitratireductor sp.]